MTYIGLIYYRNHDILPLTRRDVICQEKAHIELYYRMMSEIISRYCHANIRHRTISLFALRLFCLQLKGSIICRFPKELIFPDRLSANGENDFLRKGWKVLEIYRGTGVRPFFPPDIVMQVKALGCQLPSEKGIPLSRFSISEIAKEVVRRGIVGEISGTTIWRWLGEDAIKPWQYRSWIFPRDPEFQEKAGRVLDLYHGVWKNSRLKAYDYVICADEKPSIQARKRKHSTSPTGAGASMKVEHEYKRMGALTYLAAWDVRRARIFGRCEPKNGIQPFGRLVSQVMEQEPYRSAKRVFWIIDNGSSHRGKNCIKRLKQEWPNIIPVHLPIHASWLNQVEIYFSIVQRKVLTPNDISSLDELEIRILEFQKRYEDIADPFEWKFTRKDLLCLLNKISKKSLANAA